MPKVAVITGAAGAIGSAAATTFGRAGWDVIGIDIKPMSSGDRFQAISADLSSPEDIMRVGSQIGSSLSHVDCLVNCAAVQVAKPMMLTTDEEWDRTLSVNVTAVFRLARYIVPLLEGGAIVNISSVHARATSAGMAGYVASKGALSALTRAMALELAGAGIRVNAILPGAIEGEMLRAGLHRGHDPEFSRARLVGSTPLARVGEPDDIARLILFLADSDLSAFITGQEFVADGGVLARLASE